MRKELLRFFGLLTAAVLLACFAAGCAPKEEDTGAGYLFTTVLPDDPGCLDPQFCDDPNAVMVMRNTMEGLLRTGENGELILAGASDYTVSDDGLIYTFSLRENAYWFSKNMDADRPERVTSRDYVFAFRRLVDPQMRSPYGRDYVCIRNADKILAGEMDARYLGVSAPDGNTVQFELAYANPNFPKLLARVCAVPCNQEFFESTDGRYGLDEDTVICNGAFYLTQWNYDQYSTGNFLTFRKCKHYHDPDNVFPSSLQFNIQRSREDADADFTDGNADVLVTDRFPKAQYNDPDYHVEVQASVTMGLIFNPENELLQDEALRKALAYSIDRESMEPLLGDDVTPAYGLIPPAVTLLGASYRSVQADEPLLHPYAPEEAAELFAGAADRLGFGTMNTIRVMVPSYLTDIEALLAMSQNWQDLFGYYIGIETVTPDEFDARLASGDYTIALYSVRPEQDSCYAALRSFADRAELLGFTGDEDFAGLMTGLSKPVNLSETAALSANIEKIILDSTTFVPLFYKNSYMVVTPRNEGVLFDPFTMSADFIGAKHFAK